MSGPSGPLSDSQVGSELRKMTEFIRLEAQEKAREIHLKANEDFEKDKAALILQEKEAIDAAYATKFKQAARSLQVTRSKANSKARLHVLAKGQEVVDDIFQAARARLAAVPKGDKKQYADVVRRLVLDGLYELDEPETRVQCRKADRAVVEKAAKEAAAEFQKTVGREVSVELDEANWLADDCSGGVIVLGGNGKIIIDNTLDTRLNLLKEESLPAVRELLLGNNVNRKYQS